MRREGLPAHNGTPLLRGASILKAPVTPLVPRAHRAVANGFTPTCHAATTVAIMKNYYAPGTKVAKSWAPNTERFMQETVFILTGR